LKDEWREKQDEFLLATLPHVAFEGWSDKAMREAARDLGWDPTLPRRLFPGGPPRLVEHFCAFADRQMEMALAEADLAALRVPDRVRLAIRIRLEQWAREREAVRRAVTLLSLPIYAPIAMRATYRTVDSIWWSIGDKSTNFSFYTKRASLAAIYSATLLIWMGDQSEGFEETWAFLDRRLADIGRLPNLRRELGTAAQRFTRPFAGFRAKPAGRRFGRPTPM
jgi:ubiquinone biosynthesis protein COQ9